MHTKTIHLLPFPFLVFLGLCILETLLILYQNSGHFLYTLDDPYIHLALAENIAKGHYGINLSEYSAPSSSALWPLLLVPFTLLQIGPYAPLILNIVSNLGTIAIFTHLATYVANNRSSIHIIACVLLFGSNLIGLTFTGMEHSLQVLLAVIIATGLIVDSKKDSPPWWLLLATIIEPLVRYEGVMVSAVTILYFLCRRYYTIAFWCSVATLSLLGSFSWFLLSLGLESLPNSVIVKMFTHTNGGDVATGIFWSMINLQSRTGAILVCGLLFLTGVFINQKRPVSEKLLAGWVAIITMGHLVTAPLRDTNLFIQSMRYDAYIMATLLVILLYVYRDFLQRLFQQQKLFWVAGQATMLLVFIAQPYLMAILVTPIAANNIYEQQYQMQRFIQNYHHQPIAVNDLGLASYRNPNYVLDLWGLGKLEAFYARAKREPKDWMDLLAKSRNVHSAIIYDSWFPTVPQNWIRVATLHLSKLRLSPAESQVSFYVLDQDALPSMVAALKTFQKGLPPKVELRFEIPKHASLDHTRTNSSLAQHPLKCLDIRAPNLVSAHPQPRCTHDQSNEL